MSQAADALPKFPPAFHPLSQATIKTVLQAAEEHGFNIALVGGYIRDALLGRFSNEKPPRDFDFAVVSGTAAQLAEMLLKSLGGNLIILDEQLDTCRLVINPETQIDLAGCLGGTLQADLKRRDLTINALAWQSEQPDTIIDLSGGLQDLRQRRVRLVKEEALVDDPLRLLRVFRFAATLGFSVDDATLAAVERHKNDLTKVASERITYELFHIFDSNRAGWAVETMGKLRLLDIIFPELEETRRVTPNAFHHLGLFDHSIETLVQCEKAYCELPQWAAALVEKPLAQQISRLGATKLAALLHDIGKPAKWVVRDDGKHTFIAHETLGAEMIEETSRRMKWAKPVERFVANLVRWHLRPGALFHHGQPTDRAIYRFYRDAGPDIAELILLAQGDLRATCGPGIQDKRSLLENQFVELLQGFSVFMEGRNKNPRLLDGKDVMNILGINSGPIVGELLKELAEARSLGEVKNRQQAKVFVIERYKQKYST